jgi:putative methyltransferase (TIGR04325 family)
MNFKQSLKRFLPPIIVDTVRRVSTGPQPDRLRFSGDFGSWEEAAQASSGYADPAILERTRAALLRVKNGEAAYERDSVTFATIDYEFPLLAGLLRAAAEHDNRLSVLDFGGSLGSTYFQCRRFLAPLKELRWSIVEQPAHVLCGQRDFANEQLRFYESIETCRRVERPQVLLLSSVLQYLPKPYVVMEDLIQLAFDYIVVDRTAFLRGGADRLTREHVPAWIYPAVYPSWFLSEKRFLNLFAGQYESIASFRALDTTHPDGGEADYKGFVFKRRHPSPAGL